jgi:uncharacterized protein YlxW (UPF0749 family)
MEMSINWKKEFKKLNKDPQYLKELRKLDAEEYEILEKKYKQLQKKNTKLEQEIERLKTTCP